MSYFVHSLRSARYGKAKQLDLPRVVDGFFVEELSSPFTTITVFYTRKKANFPDQFFSVENDCTHVK